MPYYKETCQKHEEFCEVKIECRESYLRYGPQITRIVEGQGKRIELKDKGYTLKMHWHIKSWDRLIQQRTRKCGPHSLPRPSLPHEFKEEKCKELSQL